MRCPFLREAQVKFCCASEFKKLIVRSQSNIQSEGEVVGERCSSPAYASCPSAGQHYEDLPSQDHCPFLQESLSQYCSAASVVKYVPYSDPSLTRCGTSSHRYCELLMTMESPRLLTPHDVLAPEIDPAEDDANGYWLVDGIQTVGWLFYSPNHMWADVDEDGTCHVGIDAFLARILGKIDRLTFATTGGEHTPAVSLTVDGVDFQMIFPNKMAVSAVNTHLRADPKRVLSDPYTLGWLFEGKPGSEHSHESPDMRRGLIHGKRAQSWMKDETRRLTEFVQERASDRESKNQRLMADGGMFTEDFMKHLTREEILLLYNEFFSPRPNAFTNP
jgi:glycine cleavage system H lipoate-binding protein